MTEKMIRVNIWISQASHDALKILLVPKHKSFSSWVRDQLARELKKSVPTDRKQGIDTIPKQAYDVYVGWLSPILNNLVNRWQIAHYKIYRFKGKAMNEADTLAVEMGILPWEILEVHKCIRCGEKSTLTLRVEDESQDLCDCCADDMGVGNEQGLNPRRSLAYPFTLSSLYPRNLVNC